MKKASDDFMFSIYEVSDLMERLYSRLGASHKKNIDYGTEHIYTVQEVHTVSFIGANPGCTVTEIAMKWGKTKGAVSHLIKHLKAANLIYGQTDPADAKRSFLFLTESGEELDKKHKEYDIKQWGGFYDEMGKYFTVAEINTALSFLQILVDHEWDPSTDAPFAAGTGKSCSKGE